jgi:hypothetical protein
MNGRRKPRKPRVINANVMGRTIARVTLLMEHEVAQVWEPIQTAWDAACAGIATDDHIGLLMGAMFMARAINHQGIVHTDDDHFTTASDHLRTIDHTARRDGGWHLPPCPTDAVKEAVADALFLHRYQIQNLSARELQLARRAAEIAIQKQYEREAV